MKYINEAENGVLFIDEAYNLVKEDSPADFGQEAIDELLTAMVDKKHCMAVIVAGYKVPMEKFIASNPGLPSRFKTEIEFEDYDPDALEKILHKLLSDFKCHFDDEVKQVMRKQIENIYHSRNLTSFGNARDIGNFFEDISANQSRRLNMNKSQHTQQILYEDIPNIPVPARLALCGGSELKQAGEKP